MKCQVDMSNVTVNTLATSERVTKQQEWPGGVWALQLTELLTGKALTTYAVMMD